MPCPNVVVVGSANTDMVLQTEHIPAPGETIIGGTFMMAAGGKGANQAVAAARLGARVTFVARLGHDMFGDQALAGYEREGIDTSFIVRDPDAASGIAMIFVDRKGENSIAVASGANAHLSPADVERAGQAIAQADVLLVQLEVPLETVCRAVELAHAAGVRVILNPAPAQPLPPDLLARVSVLTPNEHEVCAIAAQPDLERAAAHLLQQGTRTVLVTMGQAGALWVDHQTQQIVPSFAVHAVDTTAAGDAFNGGLACALGRGLPIVEAIRYAHAVAALSVTQMGAQPSLPTASQVQTFLAERP